MYIFVVLCYVVLCIYNCLHGLGVCMCVIVYSVYVSTHMYLWYVFVYAYMRLYGVCLCGVYACAHVNVSFSACVHMHVSVQSMFILLV